MSKSKKKQDLFKKVLTKALLMYIREQIPHNQAPNGGEEIVLQPQLAPVR